MVNRPGKNSEKLQRGVAHTPLSPLVRSMVHKIAFPMNGFFIGRKFECVKGRIFTLIKHLLTQNFYIKKHLFTDVYFYKKSRFFSYLAVLFIKAGFLHKKAGFSKKVHYCFYN